MIAPLPHVEPENFGKWFMQWIFELQETLETLPQSDRERLAAKFVEAQAVLSSLPAAEPSPVDLQPVFAKLDEIPREQRQALLSLLQLKEEHTKNIFPINDDDYRGEFADIRGDKFTLRVFYQFGLDEISLVDYSSIERTLAVTTARGSTVVKTDRWADSDVRSILRALSKAKPDVPMTFSAAIGAGRSFDETLATLTDEAKQEFARVEDEQKHNGLQTLLQQRYGLQEIEASVWVTNWSTRRFNEKYGQRS